MHRFVIATAVSAILTLATLTFSSPAAASSAPPTPKGLPSAIEPLATYVGQVSCDQHTQPGTHKLADLLRSTYRATAATTYACGTDGSRSEHYDGRAIDWMVNVHNSGQHADAKAVLSWLLATDKAGNKFAMARRLGVMYVIYDNRMWGAWDGQWEEYNGCSHLPSSGNDNACHRTHMHISLGWNGAMGRTTFWAGKVSPTDYGPCRQDGMNWAYLYTGANLHGCPDASRPHAGGGASSLKKSLVTYAGASVRHGWSGPAVTAVQRALNVTATGYFNLATKHAVHRFQAAHPKCYLSGAMNISTWRVLLSVVN